MKRLRRTRLWMTIYGDTFCMIIGICAVFNDMSGVAASAIAGVLSITSMYSYSEGNRPSS